MCVKERELTLWLRGAGGAIISPLLLNARRCCRPASSPHAFAAAGATAVAAFCGMLGARFLLGQLIQTGFGADLEWARSAGPGPLRRLNACRPVMPEVAGSSPSLR